MEAREWPPMCDDCGKDLGHHIVACPAKLTRAAAFEADVRALVVELRARALESDRRSRAAGLCRQAKTYAYADADRKHADRLAAILAKHGGES